ncbi:hypothetical protein Tco_0166186 [Tanacetum coccineum]
MSFHYNICHIPQRQIRGIPGDLSLGICFPGDLSPGIRRAEKLEGDTFSATYPGDLSLGICFPGDLAPGICRAEKLEGDTFPATYPGDIVGPTQFQSNKYLPRWKVFPGDILIL